MWQLRDMQVCSNDCLELNGTKYWLHGFGDASKRAYCAVVYLVIQKTMVCQKQNKMAGYKNKNQPLILYLKASEFYVNTFRILCKML